MSNKIDMAVEIAGVKMKNPVMVASGTFGYGEEYSDYVNINDLGAIVVKGISSKPSDGNKTHRMVEVPGGLVNAIGLQNPGVEKFASDYMPYLRKHDVPVFVNMWGKSIEEYADVAEKLNDVEGIAGLEVNISCPNVKEGGLAFGTDTVMAGEVISAVRSKTTLPIIPKLSPNVSDIKKFAVVAEESGADAISLINTLPAMVIDIETRRPVLANVIGGLSGSAIHPVAVKMVWEASQVVKIPVIGMGGIMTADDAIEFIIAGATAVAVGTANFADPEASIKVIEGIEAYLGRQGLSSVTDLVGTVRL